MASNVVTFVLLLASIATAFAMVVALNAVPTWYVESSRYRSVSLGLWQFCTYASRGGLGPVKHCVSFNLVKINAERESNIFVWLEAAEAGAILSALALGAAFLSSIFLEVRRASPIAQTSSLFHVPKVMLGFAMCFMFGTGFAASMFYAVHDLGRLEFGAMYYMCWAAGAFTVMPMAISFFHHRPTPVA
eukprot:scpid101999/ scgid29499/ 